MKNMAKALKALTIGITPFAGVIILLMAALAFTACPTEGSSGSGNTVTEKNILGIGLPEFGKTPVTTITPNNQFSGTVAWDPPHASFQPRTTYKAIITLKTEGSFTLQGVPANYFVVNGAVSVTNSAGSGRVEAVFGSTGGDENNPEIVTNVVIDINRPKTGSIAAKYIDDVQYSGNIAWDPGVGETFQVGQVYTATVNLTAKRGWAFAVTQSGWSVGGIDATFTNIGQGFATVKATFPVTSNDDTPISKKGIQLSALPTTGALESSITVRDTDEYNATIEWSWGVGPAQNFNGHEYTDEVWKGRFLPGRADDDSDYDDGPIALISLSPKSGYTLEGVPANYFYIVGVEADPDKDDDGKQFNPSNTVNRGIVRYQFKKLDRVVQEPRLLDFKVPVFDLTQGSEGRGEIASLVVNNNWEYSGPIDWDPAPNTVSKRFEPGVKYTAKISLTPRKGWTFYSRGEDWFELPGAISLKHAPYTGVLTAVFPTTASNAKVTIDGLNIYLVDKSTTPPASYTDSYEVGRYPSDIGVRETRHAFDSITGSSVTYVYAEQFEQESDSISFYPNDNQFIAGKSYTATFVVKARDGFTLDGVAADSFTVNDIPAKHAAGSGIITVNLGVIPKINIAGKHTVGSNSIDNVPNDGSRIIGGLYRPVQGTAFPFANWKINDKSPYFQPDGNITWSPPLPTTGRFKDQFEPNKKYTALIRLTDSATHTLGKLDSKVFFDSPVYNYDPSTDKAYNPLTASPAGTTPGAPISSTGFAGYDGKPSNIAGTAFVYSNPSNLTTDLARDNIPYAKDATGATAAWTPASGLILPAKDKPNPSYDKDSRIVSVAFHKTVPLDFGAAGEHPDDLLGLAAPVADNDPQLVLTPPSHGLYTGTAVWYDDKDIRVDGKFKPESKYYAIVDLKLEDDVWYVFRGTETFTAKQADGTSIGSTYTTTAVVNGVSVAAPFDAAKVWTMQLTDNGRLKVKVPFNATLKSLPKEIKFDSLPTTGVTKSLGVEFLDKANFSGLRFGTVTWTGSAKEGTPFSSGNRFGSNIVYTAKFTLYLETASYTLRGLDAGATSGYFGIYYLDGNNQKQPLTDVTVTYQITNPDARSLDLTAVFPATRTALVSLPSAEQKVAKVIPKAKSGKNFHPDRAESVIRSDPFVAGADVAYNYSVIDSPYYRGRIDWTDSAFNTVWTPADGANYFDKFQDETVYYAKISLKAKDGYTFAGLDTNLVANPFNTAVTPWFSLEGGKYDYTTAISAPGTPSPGYAKYGLYYAIESAAGDTDPNQDMVIKVAYRETQTTIPWLTNPISQSPNLYNKGTPILAGATTGLDVGTLNAAAIVSGDSAPAYIVTKDAKWSTGALSSVGRFQDDWTFTGTYTVRESGKYTFKGIDDPTKLFDEAVMAIEQSSSTTSAGVTTKVFLVGYTTKASVFSGPNPSVTNVTKGAIGGSLTVTPASNVTNVKWFSNTIPSNAGGTDTGSTGNSFTIPTGLDVGTYYYYCEAVSGTGSKVASGVATVNVAAVRILTGPVGPTASGTQLVKLTRGAITSETLTVTVEPAATYFGWMRTDSPTNNVGGDFLGASAAGSTTATYALNALGLVDTYYIYCVVQANGAIVNSPVATVVVEPVSITSQPVLNSTSLVQGGLTATIDVGVAPTIANGAVVQWYQTTSATDNASELSPVGSNAISFTVPTGLSAGTYYYYCTVTANNVTIRSDVVTVVVPSLDFTGPTPNPLDLTVGYSSGNVLTIAPVSGPTYNYLWYETNSATNNTSGTAIASAGTSVTYTVPTGKAVGNYYYYCVVTANGISKASDVATVRVWDGVVSPGTLSGSGLTADGEILVSAGSGTLTVASASGTGTASTTHYQWYWKSRDDQQVEGQPVGTDANTLAVPVAEVGTRYYYCVVSGGTSAGQVLTASTNSVKVVVVSEYVIIGSTPADVANHPAGTSVTLTFTPTLGSGTALNSVSGVTYQWYSCDDTSKSNAEPIPGATNSSYTSGSLIDTTSGSPGTDYFFYCVVNVPGALEKSSRVVTITAK